MSIIMFMIVETIFPSMVMHLMIPENEDFNINEYLSDSNIKSSSSESENQLQNQLKTLQVIGIDIIKANPSGGTS